MEATVLTAANIEAHQPALFALAYRIVGRREDAEDLVQETWTSVLSSAAVFEGRSSLRTWLTRILRRRIADHYRSARRVELFDEDTTPSALASCEERLDHLQRAAVIRRALDALPPLERDALVLCEADGLERDDVGEALGVSRGHLRVLLHRGRKRVVQRLEHKAAWSRPA